jgi:arylsulfatase A
MKIKLKSMMVPLALGACMGGTIAEEHEKPNIIIVYLDDLGYGDLSCYGGEVHTPYVDRLAENGIMFTNAYAHASTCTPSRYSLLTGRYAFRVGAAIMAGDAPLLISEETPTLPGMLQKNGYKTALIGKWHLGLGDGNIDWNGKISPGPLERGFDYCYMIPATGDRVPTVWVEDHHVVGLDPEDPIFVSFRGKIGEDPVGTERPELLRFAADNQHAATIVNGVSRIGWMEGGNSARWKDEKMPHEMLKKARKFINENQENPFFMYFSFHDIHVPRLPDYRFMGATDLGPYGDVIVQMDWVTGQLVEYLEKLGLDQNTLIIFTSDNGPVLNDGYEDMSVELVGGGTHNPAGPFRGGKYSSFEAGHRLPTIAYWPKGIAPGQVSDALIGQIDLYASLASLVGHPLDEVEAPDSHNVLDALLGRSDKGRDYLMLESYTFAIRQGDYKYIHPATNLAPISWIHGNKNIESGLMSEPQLFNLAVDIGEQNNIAGDHDDLVREMEDLIQFIKDNEVTR